MSEEEIQDLKNKVFSAGRWFSGLLNPVNFAKSLLFLIQMAIIVLVVASVAFAVLNLKDRMIKAKKDAAGFSTAGTSGGKVRNSQDEKSWKIGAVVL